MDEHDDGVGVENALSVICNGDKPGGDKEQAEPGGGGPSMVAPMTLGVGQPLEFRNGGESWKDATDGGRPESDEDEEFLNKFVIK